MGTHQTEPWHLPHMDNAPNDTTRCHPRTLRQAFPHTDATSAHGIVGPVIVPSRPWWVRVVDWLVGVAR